MERQVPMVLRALFAFLALPGIVAGVVPVLIAFADTKFHRGPPVGFVVFAVGLILLLWCVRDFFVSGKGTLAPWDPPKHLVVVGLYRFGVDEYPNVVGARWSSRIPINHCCQSGETERSRDRKR